MRSIYIYSLNLKYNSIRLQAELLSTRINEIWKTKCSFVHNSNKALRLALNNENAVLFTYGQYIPGLFFKKNLNNIVFVFHNITPPKYFYKTQPLVALLALMGYIQLYLLSWRKTKWVAVSEYNKSVLERLGHKNVEVCPNIIEGSLISTEAFNKEKSRVPSILFVGRIVENKDCLALLNIVYKAAKLYQKEFELIIVGKGKEGSSYLKKFEKLIDSNPCPNLKIIRKSDVSYSELISLYKKSWLYISLSKHEGFGLPICEGLVNGIPALYSACGGQETVLNYIGLCDKDEMPQRIVDLLENDEKRALLYNQQIEIIKQYQVPMVDDTIKKVYSKYIL